jgi:hypothetical protein
MGSAKLTLFGVGFGILRCKGPRNAEVRSFSGWVLRWLLKPFQDTQSFLQLGTGHGILRGLNLGARGMTGVTDVNISKNS